MMSEVEFQNLLIKSRRLLESGDDEGCDGLIVVGKKEYYALQKIVTELSAGIQYGITRESS